jgi:hypothetical protein
MSAEEQNQNDESLLERSGVGRDFAASSVS